MNPESITLGALGAETLRQGIAFLYTQASEILRRRHDDGGLASAEPAEGAESVLEDAPEVLTIDQEALTALGPSIRALTDSIRQYAEDRPESDRRDADDHALRIAGTLRLALELVLGHNLRFRGEQRLVPRVNVKIDAERVAGLIAGVTMELTGDESIQVDMRARDIAPGAKVFGVTDRRLSDSGPDS